MSERFDPSEKYQSQIPALQALVNMGFEPLSQERADELRGHRLRNVILDEVFVKKALKINQFSVKSETYSFGVDDAYEALSKLRPSPEQLKGLLGTNQEIYDQLVLGTTISKTIAGDTKSHHFHFIDWQRPENNRYHVTAEFVVERSGTIQTRRCDIVAFVNGIPFIVIENKAPSISLKNADRQLIKYQNEDNIPHLFYYAQLLMTLSRSEAQYATVATPVKFWQTWSDEEDTDEAIAECVTKSLSEDDKDALFSGDFSEARAYFNALDDHGEREISEQDRLLYALCRPERLLDIVRRFTVFEAGTRKIARHQQFFGIRQTLAQIKNYDHEGRRRGGIVWHTQGSGKSLTMVMLGRALMLDRDIRNSRLVIVNDRRNLAHHIRDTFKSCDMEPQEAKTGADLLEKIENREEVITTVINKFETALRKRDFQDPDSNIFVLIDESHRSQSGKKGGHGTFATKMRKILPKACYIGFTGTPLLKREKNDISRFGGIIHKYTIDKAVDDKAVVPLLYEGRMVDQKLSGDVVDDWFEKVSEGLTDEQKVDLKKKFSQIKKVSTTSQTLDAKAFDISEHYRRFWQGTGLKAQLVAPSKAAAIRIKDMLYEIGHVTSEIIISPPDENEGHEEVDDESRSRVQQFWNRMMSKYGSEEEYNNKIINSFKGSDEPEILIVVSKLLTGFDAPRNTVLYLCKPLREHNLLQAIARVNRLFEEGGTDKQFGYIIDYEGLLGELDQALTTYSAFEGFEEDDVSEALHDVREEIEKLPQLHEQLWDIFKEVSNKRDMEAMEQALRDKDKREEFYEALKVYGQTLHIALSSEKALDIFSKSETANFKKDLKNFSTLKRSVQIRYQEVVDIKSYEPKIQKILDDHIIARPVQQVIGEVNINDPQALQKVVEEKGLTNSSKADRIASATKRKIQENMDTDPAFYKHFSKLLEETIEVYRKHRLSESEYLSKIQEIAQSVAKKDHGQQMPDAISGDSDAQAFYGIIQPVLKSYGSEGQNLDDMAADIAQSVKELIKEHHIVNVWSNDVVVNRIRNAIDDYFFDHVSGELGIDIPVEQLDKFENELINVAQARFPG